MASWRLLGRQMAAKTALEAVLGPYSVTRNSGGICNTPFLPWNYPGTIPELSRNYPLQRREVSLLH